MSLIRLTTKGETVIASTIDEWGNIVIGNVVTEYGTQVYLEPMKCSDTLTMNDETCLFDVSKVLSDIASVLDTLGSFTIIKVVSNSFTGLVDSVTRGNVRTLPLETITTNDVVEKSIVRRSLNEVMSVVDTIIIVPIRVCAEILGLTDTLESFSISKLISNTVNVIDSRISSMTKTPIEEVISTSDSISKIPIKVAAEVIVLDDSIVKDTIHIESENISISDSVIHLISKIITEVFSIVDTVVAKILIIRIFIETITIVDTISNVRRFLYERRSKIVNKLLQSSVVNKLLRSKVEGIKNSEAEQYED